MSSSVTQNKPSFYLIFSINSATDKLLRALFVLLVKPMSDIIVKVFQQLSFSSSLKLEIFNSILKRES